MSARSGVAGVGVAALALCALQDWGSPGEVEAPCPRGAREPHRPPAHAVQWAGAAAQLASPPPGFRAFPLHRDAPIPGRRPLFHQTPACDGSRRGPGGSGGGRTARTARGAGAELPRGGRSVAAGAASHPPRCARSPSPRRARAAACSPARSPPPLAPRAHNEAAGREVVPAAASAPLPQPMPPPAEHLALGWKGGPGGRGLGAGARPPGGGVRTRVESASLYGPPGLPDLPLGGDPVAPPSVAGGQPHPRAHRPHTPVGSGYCRLPWGP